MRARTILALATLAAAPLAAQRSHQFEFGGFGSFTRYDKAFNLDNQIGGGGRLGYFFPNGVSTEPDAGYPTPNPTPGSAPPALGHANTRLVWDLRTARELF